MRKLWLILPALTFGLGCGHYDEADVLDWYVDAWYGSDWNGDGSYGYPFLTITHALQHADKNDILHVARGTYNSSLGESFPLNVPSDITIEGDVGNLGNGSTATFVQASSSFAMTLSSGSRVRGFKITNTGGPGVKIDNANATLEFCTVTGCTSDGVQVLGTNSSVLSSNTISSNTGSGVVTFNSSTPTIQQNSIVSNQQDGVRAKDSSVPNLSGGNTLNNNNGVGLFHDSTASVISAPNNTWRGAVQGASGSGGGTGTFTSGSSATGAVAYTLANNYAITTGGVKIQF